MSLAGTTTARQVIPRSRISVGLEPSLRGSLASLAQGRSLVIDYFATRRCSVAVGDLTAAFSEGAPGPPYVELAAVEGVRLLVEDRLVGVLEDAEPTLGLAGRSFARHLSISLGRPELWIAFLERPGIAHGKGPIRLSRR